MERPIDQCMDAILNSPGVTGVLCADSKGLCLSSKGSLNSNTAGAFSLIAKQAALLEPHKRAVTLQLESDNNYVMISSKEDVTLVVAKSPAVVENGHWA